MRTLDQLQNWMTLQQRASFLGCAFKARDLIDLTSTIQYYRVTIPVGTTLALTGAKISGDGGPIYLREYPNASGLTVTATLPTEKIRKNGYTSGVLVERVNVSSPGTGLIADIARGNTAGIGARVAGTAGEAINDVFPGGAVIVFGVDVGAATINDIHIKYDWIEIDDLEGIND